MKGTKLAKTKKKRKNAFWEQSPLILIISTCLIIYFVKDIPEPRGSLAKKKYFYIVLATLATLAVWTLVVLLQVKL